MTWVLLHLSRHVSCIVCDSLGFNRSCSKRTEEQPPFNSSESWRVGPSLLYDLLMLCLRKLHKSETRRIGFTWFHMVSHGFTCPEKAHVCHVHVSSDFLVSGVDGLLLASCS